MLSKQKLLLNANFQMEAGLALQQMSSFDIHFKNLSLINIGKDSGSRIRTNDTRIMIPVL